MRAPSTRAPMDRPPGSADADTGTPSGSASGDAGADTGAQAPIGPQAAAGSTAAMRPGSRAANRAAKRAATGPVRPKTGARGGGRRSASGSSTGLILLGVIAVVIVAVAVVVLGNPFGTPTPSPSPTTAPTTGPTVSSVVGDGTCPTAQPAALPAGETRTVTITTSLGDIVMEIDGALSPIAAGNFVALVTCHFYDGSVFHRTATMTDGTPFVIQGGAAKPGTSGIPYAIQDEPVTATYHRGTLAMARTSQPNSQTSQFFIVLDDNAVGPLSSANTYAIFGEVVSGMDVADAIYAASGGQELPADPIVMTSVTVSAAPASTPTPAPTEAPATAPETSPASPATSTAP